MPNMEESNEHMTDGMLPVKSVSYTSKIWSFVRLINEAGMDPVKVLFASPIKWSWFSIDKDDGIVPVKNSP